LELTPETERDVCPDEGLVFIDVSPCCSMIRLRSGRKRRELSFQRVDRGLQHFADARNREHLIE
jgi:hypothetical protein